MIKLNDLFYADPKGLWALLCEAGKRKILGPWEDEGPGDFTGDWTPIRHRRDASGGIVAYYGLDCGESIWGVSGTVLDDQPDTEGPQEACDAYLRARGWLLIDLRPGVVVPGWVVDEGGCQRADGLLVERFMTSLLVTWPGGRLERRTIGTHQTFVAWATEFDCESFPEADINGHHFLMGQWTCSAPGCEADRSDVDRRNECPFTALF